jgi:dienelactone hydrolase
MPSTVRFLRQYLHPAAAATFESEVVYARRGAMLPATVFRPAGYPGRLPGWVVLHGLTRPGRRHRALVRFARAVASAGNVVFVPDIPEWRDLRVAPDPAIETIRAAVAALQQRADVHRERVGLFGFSFGATQALIASTEDELRKRLAGLAAWGGYCDLHRLFRFALTGQHELDGVTYRTRPDPYGVWVMAGNYLPLVPGCADAQPVADALHELAIESGEKGVHAWDPVYDDSKRRLRDRFPPAQRELFDLLAPVTGTGAEDRPHRPQTLEMADALATAALQRDPLLDPRPWLPQVRTPVVVAHGRDDRLIPFSEGIRLARELPGRTVRSATVTALFQHSGGTQAGLGAIGTAREAARFVRLLHRVLHLV